MKNRRAFSLIEISIVIITIGVLIAGIAASGSIISKARLKSARSITSGSPVASTEDLLVWLETTSTDSFGKSETANDSPITNWYDINLQRATKVNASSSGSSRPIYKSDCINGLPCLDFTAANSNYMTASIESTDQTSEELTIFLVLNFKTLDPSEVRCIFSTDGDFTNGAIHFDTRASSFAYAVGDGSATSNQSGDNVIYTGKPYIISVTDKNTATSFYVNGALTGSPNEVLLSKKFATFSIGSKNVPGRIRYSDMHLGELIIFGRGLTKEERRDITAYLGKKWNITVTQ